MSKQHKFVPFNGQQGPTVWVYEMQGNNIKPNTFLVIEKNEYGQYAAWLGNSESGRAHIRMPFEHGTGHESAVKRVNDRIKALEKREKEAKKVNTTDTSHAALVNNLKMEVPNDFHSFRGANGFPVLIPKAWGMPSIEATAAFGCKVIFPHGKGESVSYNIAQPAAAVAVIFAGADTHPSFAQQPEIKVQLDLDSIGRVDPQESLNYKTAP